MKKFLPKFLPGVPARAQLPKALPCLDLPPSLPSSLSLSLSENGFTSTKSLPESLPPTQLPQPSEEQFLCWALLFHLNLLHFGSFRVPSPSNTLRGSWTDPKPLCPIWISTPNPFQDPAGFQLDARGGCRREMLVWVHPTWSRSHCPLLAEPPLNLLTKILIKISLLMIKIKK